MRKRPLIVREYSTGGFINSQKGDHRAFYTAADVLGDFGSTQGCWWFVDREDLHFGPMAGKGRRPDRDR
ncbi:MAG: hypothetical protein ACYSR5_00605 [Planctomycetota bacterium]|jgi:hypothetical protein